MTAGTNHLPTFHDLASKIGCGLLETRKVPKRKDTTTLPMWIKDEDED